MLILKNLFLFQGKSKFKYELIIINILKIMVITQNAINIVFLLFISN